MCGPALLSHRFVQHLGQIAIPTVVLGELYAGAYRHSNGRRLLLLIEELLREVSLLNFDRACAEQFGRIRGLALRRGTGVGPVDLMIAAVAQVHDLTLVTHNTSEFGAIPDLRLEDWLTP